MKSSGWSSVAMAVVLLATVVACKKSGFDPIPEGEVDATRKASAEQIGTRILSGWAKDEYQPLGEEAREELRTALSVEGQRTSDKQIETSLGSFQSMAFHAALRTKDKTAEVYRFKGVFDKTKDPAEVRVVFDTDGKLAGFWVKPWQENI